MGTFLGDTVEVGRFKEFGRFLHEAHEVVPVIVAQDNNDVLRFSKNWKKNEM
jgi:hypothetical protein